MRMDVLPNFATSCAVTAMTPLVVLGAAATVNVVTVVAATVGAAATAASGRRESPCFRQV